jgi:acetolactate synthase-1/2/3 large subunit
MGLAVPMAIGASASYPKKTIIAITGDGSIELNIQELRTMSINRLNIKLFVINNGGYASIRKSQDDMTGGRYTDDEEVLDFNKTAGAFNIKYYKINKSKNIKKDLKKILKSKGPSLTEVFCDPNQKIIETFN